jgi:hypothetical protein
MEKDQQAAESKIKVVQQPLHVANAWLVIEIRSAPCNRASAAKTAKTMSTLFMVRLQQQPPL